MHADCVSLVYRVCFSEVSICSPAVAGETLQPQVVQQPVLGFACSVSWDAALLISRLPGPATEGKPSFLRRARIEMHVHHISLARAGNRSKVKTDKRTCLTTLQACKDMHAMSSYCSLGNETIPGLPSPLWLFASLWSKYRKCS